MSSTSDGENAKEEDADKKDSEVDLKADDETVSSPQRANVDLPTARHLQASKEETFTSQTHNLCIKESGKEWKRSLPCICRDLTQPFCDWVTCAHLGDNTSNIRQPFFLVYGLDEGSSLTLVMEKAKKKHNSICGLVLVNHSSSMTLPDSFFDSDECSKLPLHVVSWANGQVLLSHLQRLNVGEICMSRRVDTSVDDPVLTAARDSDALHSRIDEVSSFVSLENYLEEVARVKPVVAITEVLSQLQKSEGDFQFGDETVTQFICDKIQRIMNGGDFVRDFLLHMSIAYRMLSDKNYLCCEEQYSEFIKEFLRRSEQCLNDEDESQLSMVIRHFQRRDFTVADMGNGSMSFFGMICDASQKLLIFTRNIYPVGHCGLKMLWIYLDLAFRPSRIAFDWKKDFIEEESIKKDMVTQDELNWLNGAIQVGLKVELSQEMKFSGKNLVELLVNKAKRYRFIDLRTFLEMFHGTLFQNMEDLLSFIQYSHSACLKSNKLKKRSILKLGTDTTCSRMVLSEGVAFICHAVLIFGETATDDQKEAHLLKVCTTWWESILEHAMLTGPKETCTAVKLLSDNLEGAEHVSRILSGLTKEFLTKFERKMKSLRLDTFVEYYCSLSIIPRENAKVYLDSYSCQDVLDESFGRLLKHFFKDGPRCELEYHRMFLNYISASSKRYKVPSEFLDDVLSLKTEHLLADPSEEQTASTMELRSDFKKCIIAFVQKNKLSREACKCLWNVLTCGNEFTPLQQTVLEALFQFVSFKKSHFSKSDSVSEEYYIIKLVIGQLCTHYKTSDSWGVPPTALLSLYWKKLGEACQLVSPTTVSLDVMHKWVSDNQRTIRQFVIVYTQFSEVCDVTSPQSIIDVVKSSSDDNMKNYFEWILNLWMLISSWQQKICANEWTEADVKQFADLEVISSMNEIATDLCIENLEKDAKHMQEDIQVLKQVVKNTVLPIHPRGRCSVLGILRKYNVGIPHPVSQVLTKCPGNFERCLLRCIHYKGREEDADFDSLCMKDLTLLHEELQQFIIQIGNANLIDFMVHFSMHNSQIFAQYLKGKMALQQSTLPKECSTVLSLDESLELLTLEQSEGATTMCLDNIRHAVQIYHDALQTTEDFLKSIVLGEASYNSLCSLDCLQGRLRAEDVDDELNILQTFPFPDVDQCKGMVGIRPIFQLIPFASYIENIHNVCNKYQITGCLQDEGMNVLLDIHRVLVSEEERNDLNAIRSKEHLEKITSILDLPDRNWNALSLFAAVKDSADFHQFLKEKKFWGREGTKSFMQQHTLITAHLQHEEYNQLVLNYLLVAFRYISAFLDTEQNLKQLMKEVYHSCGQAAEGCSTDFVQLYTVNRNITLVRLWFSRAEGDTLENISEELKSLLSTGNLEFVIPESMDVPPSDVSTASMFWNARDQRRLLLKYQPSTPEQYQKVTDDATPTKTWSREQIENFTRKMGFLDKGSEDESHLKFQKLSAMAQQSFELLCELADLGYPQKRLETMKLEAAETLKHDLEKKLSDWRKKLKQLHCDYDKLLFFHVPKMLRMSKMLCHGDSMSEGISQLVLEVSFLFDSNKETRQQIDAALKEAVQITSEDLSLPDVFAEMQLPIARLGKVLDNLFQNMSECGYFPLPAQSPSSNEMPREPLCKLHMGTNLTPKGIIQLVYEIYKGIPAPYEVYHCRADSTEAELILFFQKILKFTYLHFCLLDVNVLPVKLQEVLLQQHLAMERQEHHCTIHYICTGSCLLEDMPWVTVKEHDAASFKYDWEQMCTMCKPLLTTNKATFSAFELVYGKAGVGKTHYIRRKIKSKRRQLTIVINESFSPRIVIQQLRRLPMESHIVLYFNFTLLQPSKDSSDVEQHLYHKTMSEVERFLFDLFFLGYVEDTSSGLSFIMPSELSWACYCEVPSGEEDNPDVSRRNFVEELPVLELVGTFIHIRDEEHQLEVDRDVQLVCKYLNAYDRKDDPIHGINKLYDDIPGQGKFRRFRNDKKPCPVRFGQDSDLPDAVCHKLLAKHMPDNVPRNKMYQKLFIGYMKRRCEFLERFPGLNYNQKSPKLGSTIMKTMLKEVSGICHPQWRSTWSSKESTRLQLIYDIKDEVGCFHLIAINVSSEELEEFRVMGVQPPPTHELFSREHLDRYLSSAFNLRLQKGKVKVIDECKYVLTLDFTLKMLEIHERLECGIPVIIEGETGVGKTALVEMLSVLLSHSLLGDLRLLQDRVVDLLKQNCHLIKTSEEVMASYMKLVTSLQEDTPVMLEDLERVCSISQMIDTAESIMPRRPFNDILRRYVQDLITSPILTVLDFQAVWENKQVEDKGNRKASPDSDFSTMLQHFNSTQDSQATAGLLFYILRAQPHKLFHKLNVHAALTPKDFYHFFQKIFKQAKDLKHQWTATASRSSLPRVMVFLDEINTSSCMGLLKEVLVDHSFFGEPIPENIFFVAACNPCHGNSVFVMERNRPYESWMRSTYNVHRLHPTLRYLRWNYGALNSQQEEQYIKAKMKMTSDEIDNFECGSLSVLISESQMLMRHYAENELKEAFDYKPSADKVTELAHSCVSQRDIQRVFTLYRWLLDSYSKFGKMRFSDDEECQLQERAVLVALGIVYYLRLNQQYRDLYEQDLKKHLLGSKTVKGALKAELDFYSKHLNIPPGIAKTQALLENIFCIIACCCTKIPLIIVGAPGSSKTLSFNLALANIKGEESKSSLFRDCKLFPALDPHFYQCSLHTTSVEVETVFQIAVKRQTDFDDCKIPINCTVFMDEAGLPEESHESLKVLHKYLDRKEVSFVAITNHLLDAAKTNRAASLFRTSMSDTDMMALARDCVGCTSPEEADAKVVDALCEPYQFLINSYEWFKDFFGLRDFIHMIHYLRCWKGSSITPQLVLNALERNFNGCEHEQFGTICEAFLRPVPLESSPDKLVRRNVIEILKESLQDTPNSRSEGDRQMYNDVRYKLIIDLSEDESLPRLLLMCKILHPEKTKIFTCSDFPEDSQLQKINTIAAIRHAAVEGHTVLMSQTDDIHDSFYDLFNQHFRCIDDPDPNKEPRFYTNVAIGSHSKPCRVHKDFQCVVIVSKSEPRSSTPPPFLNRFEKYSISHKDFLDARLQSLPPCLRVAVQCALEKVLEFFRFVGASSFYGAGSWELGESVDSILLSILPSPDYQFTQLMQEADTTTQKEMENGPLLLLTSLINALQRNAGLHFIKVSDREVKEDAVHILGQLCRHSSDHQEIAQAIVENTYSSKDLRVFVCDAVNHLHFAPAPESYKDITQESSMVITVMVQWLVMYMSKRLLQLMTAEALMLSRKRIPDWCIDAYLTHQSHFSLKELINNSLQALHNSSSTGTVSIKLICFTRSTPNIHRLPAVYSTVPSTAEHKLSPELEGLMKGMIIDELTPLYLCKLSNVLSEQVFQVHLQSFMKKEEKRVMLLVINMQETTKRLVNHIRIMVEQEEADTRGTQKLFVLLLHFPLSMVFNPCYPALFLNGWDHHYLDSVQPEPEGIVDIRQWCRVAFQGSHHLDKETSVIVNATESMIPGLVSIVSSRVSIGSKNGGRFNSIPTDGSDRIRRFDQLLSGPVGKQLCRMYARYWQPDDLAHYFEEAALYSRNHKSTVSITDSVKDFFKTAFCNFLAYMVNLINEDLNLDIAFTQDNNEILDLFLQLMDLLPNLPKLADLKAYNNTWPPRQAHATIPLFPFFRWVATTMDRLVENSVQEMQNAKDSMTTDASTGSQCTSEDTYQKKLCDTLEKQLEASLDSGKIPLLKVAVTAIGEHRTLWEKYWKDFMAKRFNLNVEEDKLTVELLNLTFARKLKQLETNKRLVMLQATAYANRINLCRLISHLRSLQKLQKVVELPAPTMSTQSASAKFMSLAEMNPRNVENPVTLYQFITDALFEALAGVCLNSGREELNYCDPRIMGIWRDSYRDVTSQASIKEILFNSSSREKAYVGKLNSMAAVFLLLQVRGELDEEICNLAFQLGKKLLELNFDKELQIVRTLPYLPEVTALFLDVVKSNPNKLEDAEMTVYLENLLTFFFSPQAVQVEDDNVKWFLHHVNTMCSVKTSQNGMELSLDEVMAEDSCVATEEKSPHMNALSIAMAKRVLGDILTHQQGDEVLVAPLHMFCGKARRLVAQALLQQGNLEGQVGPYIPIVYRQHPEISIAPNPRMEQPLADVYFLVVLEHLVGEKSEDIRLETVLKKWNNVNKSLGQAEERRRDHSEEEEMIVLQIERQAVVQMVLQTTAQSVADSNLRVSALQSSDGIKKAVQESSMREETSGHELVFMMHLLKHLHGPTALFRFLHDSKLESLSFLVASYKDKLTRIEEESTHLFPFMLPGAKGVIAQVYCKVKQLMTAMKTVKENKRAQKMKDIANGLDEIIRSKGETLQLEPEKNVHTIRFLRMAVWLVVYYEFYSKGVTCCHLMEVIQTKQQFLGFTDDQLQILKCFLLSDKMVRKPEAPLPQDLKKETLELGHDGQARPKKRESNADQMKDPIHDLFHPSEAGRDDPSDIQLRHALANLIAVTFSLPLKSTHLWYFLFDQSELEDTYLPGFRYPVAVSPKKMCYDCGVLLDKDGQFDRPDYREHSSPLSLHSFYLLEWATFGVLCMALLTNPEAEGKIRGHIISDWQPLRHFCLVQLRQIWLFLRCNLSLSDEERSFLIMQAMYRLFENAHSENLPGRFESQEDVRQYEQHWHYLYQARMHGLGKKLQEHSNMTNHGVIKTLSVADAMYPKVPTEMQFRNTLESLLGGSDPSTRKYPILAHFIADRERLAVGSALLPNLVEMYLWLDTHLAYLLSYEDASKLTLKHVIAEASKRYQTEAKHIQDLFKKLTDSYNKYMTLNGGVVGTGGHVHLRHERHAEKLTDNTPVIRLLSTDENVETEENDWLCLVMKDVVSAHNKLVRLVNSQGKDAAFHCWLPSTPLTVDVREFSTSDALFPNHDPHKLKEQILNMIRSRSLSTIPKDPSEAISVTTMASRAMFDFDKLESDVVCYYLAGKPFISDVESTLRRPFRFRGYKLDSSTVTSGLAGPGCPVDLAALSQELPESCKVELLNDQKKELEADFHSASYIVLSDLVIRLRTAAGYLSLTLQQKETPVLEQTLASFLSGCFGKDHPGSEKWEMLTDKQCHALENLTVKYLYKTLEMFVGWITDCLYDFHELPLAVKRPLPVSVEKQIEEKLAENQFSSPFLEVVEELENTVSHIAHGLYREQDINSLQPLRTYLVNAQFYSENDQTLLQLVPVEVQLQHYMYFVVRLRKLKLKLQNGCSPTASSDPKVWPEMASHVWVNFTHFQDSTAELPVSVDDLDAMAREVMEVNRHSVHQDSDGLSPDSKTSVEAKPEVIEEPIGATARHDDDQSALSQEALEQSTEKYLLSTKPSEKAMSMTTGELIEWLKTIKLSKYATAFESEDITGEELATCTLDTLKEMGIKKDLDRRKILLHFRKIK